MTYDFNPSLTALDITRTAQLDASGNAFIFLRPDVGQWWLPFIAQVSIKDPFGFFGSDANCWLYAGGPPNIVDPTFLKDFTIFAQNDTSTILSGSVIPVGECIAFQFTNGVPGQTVAARIIGLNSSITPTVGIIPQVPGSKFTGSGPDVPRLQHALLFFQLATSITTPFVSGPIVPNTDALLIRFIHNGGAGGGALELTCDWFADGALTFFTTNDLIDLTSTANVFEQSIAVKGKYLRLTITPFGATPTTYTLVISQQNRIFAPNRVIQALVLANNPIGSPLVVAPTTTVGPVQFSRVYSGPASIFVSSNATDWVYSCDYVDAAGTLRGMFRTTKDVMGGLIHVAPMPFQRTVTNNDAVSRNFWLDMYSRWNYD